MPTLEPIPERRNRDFSILHNPRFEKKEPTPLWAQKWSPKPDVEHLEVAKENPQFYSNRQIYKKVIEWFESWRPWQQRALLCGLTNRCSIAQLKSMATTLEPVFHRDFVNSLKDRYPSASLQKIKKRIRAKRGQRNKYKRKFTKKNTKSRLSSGSGVLSRQLSRSTSSDEIDLEINEGLSRETTMDCEEDGTAGIGGNHVNPNDLNTVEQFAQSFVNNVLGDALKLLDPEKDQNKENLQVLGQQGLLPLSSIEVNQKDNQENPKHPRNRPRGNPSIEKLDKYLGDLIAAPGYLQNTGELLRHHHNTVRGHRLDSRAKSSDSRVLGTRSLESAHSAMRHDRHCSAIATPESKPREFFENSKCSKLGPVQAQLRSGSVWKPPNVQDVHIPVQNMYKHVKFWSGNISGHDRVYVKPNRSQLKRQFTQQLNQVWDWMSGWKDNERLTLLAAVVKLCSSDQTSFLAQCLFDRLRERIDINWLPDRLLLLIFSYLPVNEIQNCAKVSRKWKYLTTVDELWMVKCHEYGLEQGIRDITDIVVNASKDENSIDWKQAYLEIQNITENVKSTVPLPPQLSFEAETPEDIQKVDDKILQDDDNLTDETIDEHCSNDRETSTNPLSTKELKIRQSDQFRHNQRLHNSEMSPGKISKAELATSAKIPRQKEKTRSSEEMDLELDAKSEKLSKSSKKASSNKVENSEDTMKDLNTDLMDGKRAAHGVQGIPSADETFSFSRRMNKKKTADEEGEIALDVRHSLRQSHDLKVGRVSEEYSWTKHQIETARSNLQNISGPVNNIARVRKLQGHMDSVLCVETDGKKLVSGSMDRAVRLWDIRNGRSIHKLLGHKGGVTHIQFSGETLYSGSWDTSIMVWELIHFQRRCVLTGHSESISGLKLHPEKNLLLSSAHDGTVRVWSTISHMTLDVVYIHKGHRILGMDSDGQNILTSGSDRTIKVTNLTTRECIRVISKHPGSPEHLVISGDLCITTNFTGQVFFWNLTTGELEAGIQGHDSSIKSLAYYNGRIYTASTDATIKEWDLVTLTCIRTLQGHKGPVNSVSATSKFIVTCSTDGHIRVWDREMPKTGGEDDCIRLQVIDQRDAKQSAPKSADSTMR